MHPSVYLHLKQLACYSANTLLADGIWIEDRRYTPIADKIKISKRIGIEYAEEDAELPYRFECFDFKDFPILSFDC